MKKNLLISFVMVLIYFLVPINTSVRLASAASEIKSKVLKGVSSYTKSGTFGESYDLFANKLKEKSSGALTLNLIGASDAIRQPDQPKAVQQGIVDFHYASFSTYEKVLPVTIGAPLDHYTPMEDRQKGIYEFWNNKFEKYGLHYLGIIHCPGENYFFLNKQIINPHEDFKGLKLRTSNTYFAFIKALGAVPVTVGHSETYSALQTGVVDGSGWVCDSIDRMKGYEVLKYYVDVPFYRANTIMVVNLKTWNSLDKTAQDIISQVANEVEAQRWKDLRPQDAKLLAKFEEKGMQPIKLSAENTKWYIETADEAKWAEAKAKVDEEDYATMRKLFAR